MRARSMWPVYLWGYLPARVLVLAATDQSPSVGRTVDALLEACDTAAERDAVAELFERLARGIREAGS